MERANAQAWKELEEQRANLQPTPPVGEKVRWYPRGNTSDPVAAQVTGIEGPGRLKLKVFPRAAFPSDKQGVYHVSAKIHQKPGNPTTNNWGAWDYVRPAEIPDEDYTVHRQELEKLEFSLLKGEEDAKAAAENFAAKQAERQAAAKSGKKRPIPAPESVAF